jgi:bacteriorhodopsin
MNMKNLTAGLLALCLLTLLFAPTASAAGGSTFDNGEAMSSLERVTYISFVAISLMFIGAAFFLFMERNDVARRHRPAIGIGVMIVGIAGFQYALMQDVYLSDGSIPTDFRYADWLTTVPLMAVTFAVLAGRESFTNHRLFSLPGMSVPGIIILGSLFMMVGGYIGQLEIDQALADGTTPSNIHWFFFAQGCVGYLTVFLIVGTPFTGAYGIDDAKISEDAIRTTMGRLRRLILIGWIIYPAGYILGAVEAGGEDGSALMMLVYNIADLVNKLAFVIIVLVGTRDTEEAKSMFEGLFASTAAAASEPEEDIERESLMSLAALSQELADEDGLDGEL